MRTFAATMLAFLLFLGALGGEAASPRPMARAHAVLGEVLGVKGARIKIRATHLLRANEQLVSFSVVVPSIFSNAGVAYVGTALLKEGRDGKARSARLGSLDIHGTGVFSGLYEQQVGAKTPKLQAATASPRKKVKRRARGNHTPWGTALK